MKTLAKTRVKRSVRRKPAAPKQAFSVDDIRDLRVRLAPGPQRPLSQQRFSHLLGVSWSTVARWEGGGRPDTFVAQKLIRLRNVLDALGDMVRPEHRLAFLEQAHPLLLSLRPIDLLDNDNGCAKVVELLEGMETGAFA